MAILKKQEPQPSVVSQYAKKLTDILSVAEASDVADEVGNDRTELPADSEISLRDNIRRPDYRPGLVNADMRTANLTNLEFMVCKKLGIFGTWLDSFQADHRLQKDPHLSELKSEVEADMRIVLNLSVAKGGHLLSNLLNPRKTFSLLSGDLNKKGPLQQSRGGGG